MAYEPNPEIFAELHSNTGALSIELFAEAVGSTNEYVGLTTSPESNQVRVSGRGPIHQVSLRTVLERAGGRIDLLKLDCEGAEWAMFRDWELWQQIEWLTMEYHLWAEPNGTHEHASKVVGDLGFKIVLQKPQSQWGLLLARRKDYK